MSQRAGRNAAHCPGWPLQRQGHPKCFANRFAETIFGPALDPGDLGQPSGPDGEGQARGQARDARGEPPQLDDTYRQDSTSLNQGSIINRRGYP